MNEYRQGAGGGWQRIERGIWQAVPASAVPAEAKEAARRAALEPKVAPDHDLALEVEYVRARYIPGTNPRLFLVDGEAIDAGLFAHHYADRFGRSGLAWTTLYTRLNELLVLGGFRLKAESSRRPSKNVGGPRGTGHYPKNL